MWRTIMMLAALLMFLGLDLAWTQAQKPAQSGDAKTPSQTAPPEPTLLLKRIMLLDLDRDGKISKTEARGKIADNFAFLDANQDGFLDREEIQRLVRRLVQGQGSGPPPPSRPADFDALDSNADGRLSRAELRNSPLLLLFDQIDTNHDGLIDRLEFGQWLEKQASSTQK